jgi:gamma-glutamyltranspeptidase / glutathione hydrolase
VTRVAVAAPNRLAVAAGLRLAEAGGNAVDAALAAVLASQVTEPGVCGLVGGSFVTVGPPGQSAVTVDGGMEMPGRGLPPERFGRGVTHVTTEYGGGVTATVGHGSVATPGALAAYEVAHRRFGRVAWPEVLAPAIEVARAGFPLGHASAYYLGYTHEIIFGQSPDSYAALHDPNGRVLTAGDRVHVPHLPDSLELLAEKGAGALYGGELGEKIVADMDQHDGLVTKADLTSYRPVVRPSLQVALRDWQLATNPPPAIGGPVLAAMLALMGGRPHGVWTEDDVSHLIAVQDAVLRYRLDHLDRATDRVAAANQLLALVAAGDLAVAREAPSTVHVSAVDDRGTACAITASDGYGSGVMVPGTGLWLNSGLGEPELNPYGLHGLPPGQRLASNMAPTIGRRPDGAVLAIGSPGADRITTALLQVLAAFANGGMGLAEAIAWPRLHVRHAPVGPVVEHEEDVRLPPVSWRTREHHAHAMYFGGVGAALAEPDGRLTAAADPRRAAAIGVSET